MIELGLEVTDQITGFRGIVVGRVEYLSGCRQHLVQPQIAKGETKRPEPEWFDEQRLQAVPKGKRIVLANAGREGFDAPAPKR